MSAGVMSQQFTYIKFKYQYNVPKSSYIGSKQIYNIQRFEVCKSIFISMSTVDMESGIQARSTVSK